MKTSFRFEIMGSSMCSIPGMTEPVPVSRHPEIGKYVGQQLTATALEKTGSRVFIRFANGGGPQPRVNALFVKVGGQKTPVEVTTTIEGMAGWLKSIGK